MSSYSARATMVPITRRVRAYFAAMDRDTGLPVVFDPSKQGGFALDSPPAPWFDLGWVDNFKRECRTMSEAVRAGTRGAAAIQFRSGLDASVEFDFREWGKLQMALAGGAEHLNVLAADANADLQPSGGTPIAAIALQAGSSASELILGEGAVNTFSVGDVIAADADYAQQLGYVGTGISAAYIVDPANVRRDVNYIRRVTFNVARVAEKTATSLLLGQALLGGVPPVGAAVQKVVAFVDREGGAFFQEWSALFVLQEESGGRACFYYPRLSSSLNRSQSGTLEREPLREIAKPLASVALHASFIALPHTDENDGETVLCYRSYFPAAMSAVY